MDSAGYPPSNQYSAVINDGFLIQGNNYVQLNDSTINIETLIDHLKTTTQQCSDLKSLFLDRPSPVAAAQDFSRDVDELQGLVETLQSYVGENHRTSFQGIQRPWLELDNMTLSFQRIMERTKELVEISEGSVEGDIVNAMAMRAEARRLRTKLTVAIGVLAFCSCSDARDPHVQELQFLYERLRSVQEEVENERALNLPPADPVTVARLERLSTHDSLIMRKFLAHSLTSDRVTLTESSMRVSTLICEEDLVGVAGTSENLLKLEDVPTEQQSPPFYVRVLYDWDEMDENSSLMLHRGDIVQVILQTESGWWDGVLDGIRGCFPSRYCELIDVDIEDARIEMILKTVSWRLKLKTLIESLNSMQFTVQTPSRKT